MRRTRRGPASTRNILLAGMLVAIVGATAGYFIYRDRVKPFTTVVLVVDGTSIDMRYFLKRLAISGQQPLDMLQTLANEEILETTATRPPYGITVTDADIDGYARDLARGDGEPVEEKEFREWHRQQLNMSRFTDAEFRDLLKASLVSARMNDLLVAQLPATAEQVFLNMITIDNYAVGETIRSAYGAGNDFAALARTYSLDATTKDDGGKLGWVPRGVLDAVLDEAVFALDVGEISDPLSIDEKTFIIFMVSERVAARPIDEPSLQILKGKVLDEWLEKEFANHTVELHGFHNGYDSETDSWVTWQLARMQKAQPEDESE